MRNLLLLENAVKLFGFTAFFGFILPLIGSLVWFIFGIKTAFLVRFGAILYRKVPFRTSSQVSRRRFRTLTLFWGKKGRCEAILILGFLRYFFRTSPLFSLKKRLNRALFVFVADVALIIWMENGLDACNYRTLSLFYWCIFALLLFFRLRNGFTAPFYDLSFWRKLFLNGNRIVFRTSPLF